MKTARKNPPRPPAPRGHCPRTSWSGTSCGPVQFSGDPNASYDRHLVFDHVVRPGDATPRERFEALARSLRDLLSQRWLKTGEVYDRENPKQVYYLSMEFLIGRSTSNNLVNLLVEPFVREAARGLGVDLDRLGEEEPDAGLGNGGLGRLAACFLDSMATLAIPADRVRPARTSTASSARRSRAAGRSSGPTTGSDGPTPGRSTAPRRRWTSASSCAVRAHGGAPVLIPDAPTVLRGVPYDRPVVGYGGRTVNTLRLWGAAATDAFDFAEFSGGDFFGAVHEKVAAESLTRVLYPDDSTRAGEGLRFAQEYFLVCCSLADIVRRFRRRGNDWKALPDKVAIQLNDTHPALAVAELMRILLDEAGLGWDEAWDLTVRTLAYTNHTLLPGGPGAVAGPLLRDAGPEAAGDRLRGQPPVPRRGPRGVARRRRPGFAGQPDRGGPGEEGPDGAPGGRRVAQHQRRRRAPLPAAAGDRAEGPRRAVPRAVQQQDQRGHPPALAAPGQPRPLLAR